ncbi:hypothetical protein HPP92_026996 [Vanilla planifolia]|uniref:Programmed cell death protein 2 C-terminal domain-containing protein n=2 Tax=Vanilla planifolia TaxID=51239 RepID=A0A835PE36_VANPL|nr:hypothetical protein HPP92_026996 [Vanilla planifolia]
MSRVMLGMPGPWAEDFREEADHYTTKIGGLPDWPVPNIIEPELLKCRVCGEMLGLVAQIYAPISMPKSNIDDRVLYIFGCSMPKCGSNAKCWRALRVQKCIGENPLLESSKHLIPVQEVHPINASHDSGDIGDEIYNALDFGDLVRELSEASLLASQSRKPKDSLHAEPYKRTIQSKSMLNDINSGMPVVPCFYVYPQEENTFRDISGAVFANFATCSLKGDDSVDAHNEEEAWEGETYEYDKSLGADRTYLKFKKRMDTTPEQCFRYAYGGRPLLGRYEVAKPDNCDLCGSPRHYEMQLMPPLLFFLHEAADGLSTSVPEWSWMTLMVYTCSSSCCPSSCREQAGSCCWGVTEEAILIQDD